MNEPIIIGHHQGSYTPGNGNRTITIDGLSFILKLEAIRWVYNNTQNLLYYVPTEDVALVSVSAGNILIDGSFPILQSGDIITIIVSAIDEESSKVDEVSIDITYIGKAALGTASSTAAWKIIKMVTTGTVTENLYADGDASYNNIWDDRASLSYS